MDPQLQSLRFWHDLILIDALLLGIEAPVLLFVGTLLNRLRIERALALLPALAFGWGAWSAKLINDQLIHADSALQWGYAHFPALPVTVDAAAAVASATRTGWAVGAVTTLLLIGGWVLVLRWSRGKGLPSWRPVATRPPRAGRATGSGRAPVTSALDETADEGLEITVESMDP